MTCRFDEVAFACVEHLDPDYVATYDRKAGFDPCDDIALLRELGLGERGTLVDPYGAGASAPGV